MLKAEWSSKAGQAMKPKVYVETTILSYLAARPSRQPVTAGRQVITRQWWETERKKYNLVVSEVVEAECGRGNAESASRRRGLLGEVSLFPLKERILELARLLDSFEPWLHQNDHLYAGRAYLSRNQGKMKCSKRFTRSGTPTRRSTAMTWIKSMQT